MLWYLPYFLYPKGFLSSLLYLLLNGIQWETKMINQYIDNITKYLRLTDNKLRESKQEQREIINEISIIKRELDDLVKTNEDDI